MNTRRFFATVAFLAFGFPAASISAQVRFAILDSTVRLSNYTTVEECLGLAERLTRQYGIKRDSSRYNSQRKADLPFQPNPPIVTEWTRKCMAKFRADTAPIDSTGHDTQQAQTMLNWESGYLTAIDVSSALKIMDRQLAALPDSMIFQPITARRLVYQKNRSIDVEWNDVLDSVILARTRHLTRSPTAYVEFVKVFGWQMERAWSKRRVPEAQRKARELLDYITNFKLTDEENDRITDGMRGVILEEVHLAQHILGFSQMQDSIRVGGPEAYVRLRRRMWEEAQTYARLARPLVGVGVPAKPVNVSFIFPRDSAGMRPVTREVNADSSIPSPEKVTLLVFQRNACREEGRQGAEEQTRDLGGRACFNSMGVIRRLARRFPSLDITIVTQTEGVVGPKLTADSLEEARLIRSLWHDHHRLPVNIAVAYTPFFRLPAPDSRRVNRGLDHNKYYAGVDFFGGAIVPLNNWGFIIAPGRTVLERMTVLQASEDAFLDLLTPLMEWYERTHGSGKRKV